MKYGLLEGRGEEIKISDRAMQILHPQSQEEKAQAIKAAAAEPALFREIAEKFPGRAPTEEVLRNYLVRSGFAPAAVPAAILAYRETNEFVEREAGAYDSGPVSIQLEPGHMQLTGHAATLSVSSQPKKIEQIQDGERQLGRWDFEGGSYVRIMIGGDVDTEAALDMVELIVGNKRKELERINARRLREELESKN